MDNTVGIIDSDYFASDNEGHIFVKLTNDSHEGKTVEVKQGTAFVQGVFVEYGITVDDEAQATAVSEAPRRDRKKQIKELMA